MYMYVYMYMNMCMLYSLSDGEISFIAMTSRNVQSLAHWGARYISNPILIAIDLTSRLENVVVMDTKCGCYRYNNGGSQTKVLDPQTRNVLQVPEFLLQWFPF